MSRKVATLGWAQPWLAAGTAVISSAVRAQMTAGLPAYPEFYRNTARNAFTCVW